MAFELVSCLGGGALLTPSSFALSEEESRPPSEDSQSSTSSARDPSLGLPGRVCLEQAGPGWVCEKGSSAPKAFPEKWENSGREAVECESLPASSGEES